jgi:cytochrome c oxidase subunit 4
LLDLSPLVVVTYQLPVSIVTHSPKLYWSNCIALLLLLGLTWGIGYINLGPFNLVVSLVISIIKTVLIVLFFMHIKGSSRILHLAACLGVVWWMIMLVLTLADYHSRGWIAQPKY